MTPVPRQPVTAGTGEVGPAGTPTGSTLADTVRALEAELATLQAIAGTILSTHDVERVLLSINERLLSTLEAEIAGALLSDGDELVMKSCVGHQSEATARLRMRRGEGLAGLVFQTGEPHKIDDYDHDRRISRDVTALAEEEQVRSALAVPLRVRGQITGVIEVWRRRPSVFTGEDSRRMQALAGLAAIAIDNARLYGAQSAALRELADARSDLDAQVGLLRQAATLQRRLTELVLSGSNSTELVRTAAEETGCGVVVVTRDGAALASHPAELASEAPIRKLLVDDAPAAGRSRPESVTEELPDGRVAWRQPIRVGVEAIDSVYLIGHDRSPQSGTALFAELVATAIANAEARSEVARLVQEQAALRRVAMLVAREAPQPVAFSAIAEEIGQLLGTQEMRMVRYDDDRSAVVVGCSGSQDAFPLGSRHQLEGDTAASRVLRTGRTARIDDYGTMSGPMAETARSIGVRSAVGAPIIVEGRLWGAIVTGSTQDEPLPPDTESRLGQFTELMATAVANTEALAKADRLADEQAALRRVATLVAQAVQPAEIFAAVSDEVGRLFGSDMAAVARFDPDGPANVVVGLAQSTEGVAVGSRWELDDAMASAEVYRTGSAARVDAVDWSAVSAPIAGAARRLGIVSTVSSPIAVEGRLWGAISVSAKEPLPLDADERLEKFTDLVATAIANAEARAEVERLAEEQAALRRVATLVAEGAPPTTVFDAVAAEMEGLLGADRVSLSRYEPGAEITVLAHRGSRAELVPSGSRLSHEGDNVQEMVRRTERPARMENFEEAHGRIAEVQRTMGVRVVVAAPVVVDGRVWGVIGASWVGEESPPPDTEERMTKFAGLLETAIANADSRDQLTASRARLLTEADEARRRVVRDLHDGGQQRLVHAILTLKNAQQALRENDGSAESLIGEALEQAKQGNAELRELAHGILPPALTHGGLRAGVDAVVERLDLPVQADVPTERFAEELEASAYFIVAEALTNVVKHSHARHADVKAFVDDGMLHVVVRDDGLGGADPEGHGLLGMADRVTALGGRLDIESPADGGTLLAATLPVSPSR
jgi:GAF domain-containing protein